MKEMTDEELLDLTLGEDAASVQEEPSKPVNEASKYLGQKLGHNPATGRKFDENNKEKDSRLVEEKGLSRVGENLLEKAEVREGWIDVNRELLGDRSKFYPEDWQFRIRPATVEAIRNWSTIDDENPNSIDDVFNEILKSCISITTPEGPKPWGNICSWDRFFFLLLIREYTFEQGETKIQYEEPCPECDNDVTFTLTSQSLMYDLPDPEVMPMYDQETRTWNIDPEEYDLEGVQPITLYVPTLEKDANIKAWLIARVQENRNRKIDQVLLKFLPWMTPKISKDETIARRQIREQEMKYKAWDGELFSFMDDVIRNIMITPSSKLTAKCPVCGEEVTNDIRFPGSIRDLFNVPNKHKKFGKK